MDKVIKGTKDLHNYKVVKGPQDARQIRCPGCKELASQVPDGKGGTICQCSGCGKKFKFRAI